MTTSINKVSHSSKIILAVLIGISLIYVGCSESPGHITGNSDFVPDQLERKSQLPGKWLEILPKDGESTPRAELTLREDTGTYIVPSSNDEASPVTPHILKSFEYEEDFEHQTLHIKILRNEIDGEDQSELNERDVNYTVDEMLLRIFGKTFTRQ